MKTPSKWGPQGHAYTLPTDAETHRRVMLEARRRMVEAGEDGDIRSAMAAFVAEAVERMERPVIVVDGRDTGLTWNGVPIAEVPMESLPYGAQAMGIRFVETCPRCLREPTEECVRQECGQGTDR